MYTGTRFVSPHQDVPIESATMVIRPMRRGMTLETTRSEGGKPAAQALGLKFLEMEPGSPSTADYQIGSGDYTFMSTLPPAPETRTAP